MGPLPLPGGLPTPEVQLGAQETSPPNPIRLTTLRKVAAAHLLKASTLTILRKVAAAHPLKAPRESTGSSHANIEKWATGGLLELLL